MNKILRPWCQKLKMRVAVFLSRDGSVHGIVARYMNAQETKNVGS